MKITLLLPDNKKGTFGVDDNGLKLSIEWGNKKSLEIWEKMNPKQIEGSIWEAKISHNDLGDMVFTILDFITCPEV